MYSIVGVNCEENKKPNGVNKNVVKNTRHKTFVNFFFNKNKMKRIKNKLHRIVTYEVCKMNFSCFDDKR